MSVNVKRNAAVTVGPDYISNIYFGAQQLGNFSCDVGELPLGHHPDWRDGENYGGEGFYRYYSIEMRLSRESSEKAATVIIIHPFSRIKFGHINQF